MVSIEAIRQPDETYQAFTDNGRNRTDRDAVSWAREVQELGAGEILLTSVDQEGTGAGLDTELIRKVHSGIKIPLVVNGGVGRLEDVVGLAKEVKVSGVAIASMLHYHYLNTNRQVHGFEEEGNTEFLKSNRTHSKITPMTLAGLKEALSNNQVSCRLD